MIFAGLPHNTAVQVFSPFTLFFLSNAIRHTCVFSLLSTRILCLSDQQSTSPRAQLSFVPDLLGPLWEYCFNLWIPISSSPSSSGSSPGQRHRFISSGDVAAPSLPVSIGRLALTTTMATATALSTHSRTSRPAAPPHSPPPLPPSPSPSPPATSGYGTPASRPRHSRPPGSSSPPTAPAPSAAKGGASTGGRTSPWLLSSGRWGTRAPLSPLRALSGCFARLRIAWSD